MLKRKAKRRTAKPKKARKMHRKTAKRRKTKVRRKGKRVAA